jgi:hypothetical protein
MKLRKKLFEDYLEIYLLCEKKMFSREIFFHTCCSALRLDLARTIAEGEDSSTVIVCLDTFIDRLIYSMNENQ